MNKIAEPMMDEETQQLLDSFPKSAEPPEEVGPLTYTNYSRKDRIREANGRIYGAWSTSFSGACGGGFGNYIERAAVVQMRSVGPCNGVDIIMCEHH